MIYLLLAPIRGLVTTDNVRLNLCGWYDRENDWNLWRLSTSLAVFAVCDWMNRWLLYKAVKCCCNSVNNLLLKYTIWWFKMYDVWCVMCDVWCVMLWCMMYDVWCVMLWCYDVWCMMYDVWRVNVWYVCMFKCVCVYVLLVTLDTCTWWVYVWVCVCTYLIEQFNDGW